MRISIIVLLIFGISCSDNKEPDPSSYEKILVGEACKKDEKGDLLHKYVELEGFLQAPDAIWGHSTRIKLYEAPGEGDYLMIDLMADSTCTNCMVVKGKNVYIKDYLKIASDSGLIFPFTDKVIVGGDLWSDVGDPGCHISPRWIRRAANQFDIPLYRPVEVKIGEPATIKDIMYTVKKISYSKTLGENFFEATAIGEFLVVELSVQNNGSISYYMSSNNLILKDESGKVYESSMTGESALESAGKKTFTLNELNTGESITASIVYDVPDRRIYTLSLNKGTQMTKNFIVKLIPEQ